MQKIKKPHAGTLDDEMIQYIGMDEIEDETCISYK